METVGFGAQRSRGRHHHGNQSFCERMGNAMCGVVFGVFMFLGGIYLTYWNEGRSVHTSCAIYEASQMFTNGPSNCVLDTSHSGGLVYASCDINRTTSLTTFTYPDLGVQGVNGIKFTTTIQQLQDQEQCDSKKDNNGNQHEYCTYQPIWRSSQAPSFHNKYPSNSPSFAGFNPPFPSGIPNRSGQTARLEIGSGYILPSALISQAIASTQTVRGTPPGNYVDSNTWNKNYPNGGGGTAPNRISNPSGTTNFHYASNGRYFESTPSGSTARLGDLRIQVSVSQPAKHMSVLAKQNADGTFGAFTFPKCDNYGFSEYAQGDVSAQALIDNAKDANTTTTYVLRLVCFIILWFGMQLCVAPLAIAPDIIPCIGGFLSDLVGCMLCVATCVAAVFWFTLVFAISWVYFRPMVGIPLFCVSFLFGGGLVYWRLKAKRAAEARQGGQNQADTEKGSAYAAPQANPTTQYAPAPGQPQYAPAAQPQYAQAPPQQYAPAPGQPQYAPAPGQPQYGQAPVPQQYAQYPPQQYPPQQYN